MEEIIDISSSIDELPSINMSRGGSDKPSVNFGGGIELLMNDKRKNENKTNVGADINLADLDELEDELNGLSNDIGAGAGGSSSAGPSRSTMFSQALNSSTSTPFKLNRDDASVGSVVSYNSEPNLGRSTAYSAPTAEPKTWDGFSKFSNVPLNPDKVIPDKPKMTAEELLLEKFKVLRKLEDIERKGATLTKKYSMESSLAEMQGEYEMIISEKERSNSCKFQGRMLMAAVTGLEFLNNRFDPFDVKLDGWAEQINENINEYDEIFAELHEKYKSKAKMAPELKLLFQLGGSAIMVHMTNTMFKSAMPGMDDIMRQNPELMQQFTQAAVNTMGESNPGLGNFMGNFMPSTNKPPPPPLATQGQQGQGQGQGQGQAAQSARMSKPPSNRPDLVHARDGISIEEQFASVAAAGMERSPKPIRPEMKGPTDINDLLAGMKTKTIQTAPQSFAPQSFAPQSFAPQSSAPQSSAPQSSAPQINIAALKPQVKEPAKRKNKSDRSKNTVSLDI